MCRRSAGGIGEVAVVGQHQAERGIHVERLGLGGIMGRARGGIAHMGDAPIALQVPHVARAKHVAHQTGPLVHAKTPRIRGGDSRGVLAAVLEHLQAIVEQLVHGGSGDHPKNSAHETNPI